MPPHLTVLVATPSRRAHLAEHSQPEHAGRTSEDADRKARPDLKATALADKTNHTPLQTVEAAHGSLARHSVPSYRHERAACCAVRCASRCCGCVRVRKVGHAW